MKLEELRKQKNDIELKIKKMERREAQKGLLKRAKEVIGSCYRFRNGYSGATDHWYIYAIVKDVKLEDSSVYMILDQYEITNDGEIKISLNNRQLESCSPMHCWEWIKEETFEENKQKALLGINKQ